MFYRAFIAIVGLLATGALILNAVWLVVLALPLSWLWNWTLVPLVHAPVIDYGHALGLLLLWHVLRSAAHGVQLSANLRKPQ